MFAYFAAGDEIGWMTEVDWTLPFLGVCAAFAVLWVGRRLSRGDLMGSKPSSKPGRDLDFDLEIARLESQAPVKIAQAKPGLVHLRGVLRSAQGNLGGPAAQARVWYNQAQAPGDAAVGVELCLMGDDTGQVALEELGQARVIAPLQGQDSRYKCLQLGDEVEVLGEFIAQTATKANEAPHERVFGLIGRGRTFQVRVLTRPDAQPQDAQPEDAP